MIIIITIIIIIIIIIVTCFSFHSVCRLVSVLKKVKHRVVESLNSGTADAMGLSRAILCNGEREWMQ